MGAARYREPMTESGMAEAEQVRRRVGGDVSDTEVAALADWYRGLAQAVARFPEADLKAFEPPLRSTPGPHA